MKRYAILGALCLAAFVAVAAVVPVVTDAHVFTTTVDIPITNSDLQPSYITAAQLSFPSGVNNTFTLDHISDGVTNRLVTGSDAAMQSLTWYAPRPLFLKDGDVLRATNTDATQATLKLSIEKYKN
jgi:hypothetical protein